MLSKLFFALLIVSIVSCVSQSNSELDSSNTTFTEDTIDTSNEVLLQKASIEIQDSSFINISDYSDNFAFEMRYATSNNFLKEKVYDCENCLMRHEVAKALIKANDSLIQLGYRIKFYDCFRPVEVQKKMWEIFPDARYVANPASGSIHNKGAALDITLIELDGDSVDMGTDFDHFGEEAHHAYDQLDEQILKNRVLLKNIMIHYGFDAIRTEWWHYNFNGRSKYGISSQPLCE